MNFGLNFKKANGVNTNGSAIVIVLALVSAMMVSGVIVLQASKQLAQTQAWSTSSQVSDNVSQLIKTVVSDSSVCLLGYDGTGSAPGLQFAGNAFNLSQASQATGQDISLPGLYPAAQGSAVQRFASGLAIPNSQLTLQRLYVANAAPDSSAPNTYNMDLMAQIAAPGADRLSVRPRTIASLSLQITAGALTGCTLARPANSNQALCESMNCTYSVATNGQGNCFCQVKPVACTNGTYVASIVNYVPQCGTQVPTRSCASTPNGFLVALDQNTQAVCATAYSCPVGTSGAGLGAAANPIACKCNNAGETWNGSACSVPIPVVNGQCGGAQGGTFADATAANSAGLCSAGSANPVALAGAGPWNWSCNGSGGGGNMACSAQQTAPPIVVVGQCGGAHGGTFADATAANAAGLCASGIAAPVTLSGAPPWNWSCNGSGGGGNMACSATNTAPVTCTCNIAYTPGLVLAGYSPPSQNPPPIFSSVCTDCTAATPPAALCLFVLGPAFISYQGCH